MASNVLSRTMDITSSFACICQSLVLGTYILAYLSTVTFSSNAVFYVIYDMVKAYVWYQAMFPSFFFLDERIMHYLSFDRLNGILASE